MAELSVVGKSVTRIDALEKVTGKALFCTDIKLPRMLHAKVLRSPFPHARILHIDTSKARKLRGVRCVVTSQDAPEKRYGGTIYDQTIFANGVARFVGESVAAVAAETWDIAREAIELIEVTYEPLPAVFDVEEAMNEAPPAVIHPDLLRYIKSGGEVSPDPDLDRPNIHHHYKLRKGDVQRGFKEADYILENRFTSATLQHCPLEPHAAIAQVDVNGNLTVYTGRQMLHRAKTQLSYLFDIPPANIRVISPYIGGGFGNKIVLVPSAEAVLLALVTGRPVKLVLTREEVFTSTSTRGFMIVHIKDGFREDGTVVAREISAIIDSGAYCGSSGVCATTCVSGALATYRVPHIKFDSYAVYTNNPICGALRGLHSHLPTMAVECHMNLAAKKLGIDPTEIRRKNILTEGEENYCGERVHSICAIACLDKMAKFMKVSKLPSVEGSWRTGRGIALANHYSRPTASSAIVKVHENGVVEIRHSANELGQGCNTVMAQIAAEEFGVSLDSVKVVFMDSAVTPYDHGSIGSRTTYTTGNAVRLACQDAKRQLFKASAPKLRAAPEQLETRSGIIFVKEKPEQLLRISALFQSGGYLPQVAEVIGKATFIQDFAPRDRETGQIDPDLAKQGKRWMSFYTYGAQVAEVAVNTETGQVKVLRFGSAFDMGQPINPKMCEQQMEGGMGMGIGSTLFEEMKMERGQVLNPNFTDYLIPSATEMPLIKNVKSVIAPAPHREGPFGAKGIGEGVMMPTPPAIANAIYDATGIMMMDIPITPERMLQALKTQTSKKNCS